MCETVTHSRIFMVAGDLLNTTSANYLSYLLMVQIGKLFIKKLKLSQTCRIFMVAGALCQIQLAEEKLTEAVAGSLYHQHNTY
jgi:hypothetical protein